MARYWHSERLGRLTQLCRSPCLLRILVGYRQYQDEHIDDTLGAGVAFPFIKRLLSLNDLSIVGSALVEVSDTPPDSLSG